MARKVAEGRGEEDVDEQRIKAALVRRIALTIQEMGITQREAAELLGADQPKVSALVGGNVAGFTVSRLIRFVAALGHDVELTVKPRDRRARNKGTIAVHAP